jgi:hypothetical protein
MSEQLTKDQIELIAEAGTAGVIATAEKLMPIIEKLEYKLAAAQAENERLCVGLLNVSATAVRWAVANGGDTPLAIIAKMARETLGLSSAEVFAECDRIKAANSTGKF